jgi:homoserine O-acetyltransferase/O-succinyltransferase
VSERLTFLTGSFAQTLRSAAVTDLRPAADKPPERQLPASSNREAGTTGRCLRHPSEHAEPQADDRLAQMSPRLSIGACLALALMCLSSAPASTQSPSPLPNRREGDYVIRGYTFRSGGTLPEVRLHYTTVGTPIRDSRGKIRNAILVMHGSSSPASQVLAASFTGPLVGAGLALDPDKYFLIFPDLLGAGGSSKPSDGLHARFPKYGYNDMVDLEHRLISEHFGIERLRAVMGISMGGMHTWIWGARYPAMMDALVPISSLPTKIDGRNLLWRRILVNAIRTDPEWKGGEYTQQPRGFLNIMPMFDMLVQSPARLGERLTSYQQADAYLDEVIDETLEEDDANNILYRFEASFDYDLGGELEAITAPVLAILFADDELNPIELGAVDASLARIRRARHVIVPRGPSTEGHRTQVRADVWKDALATFLASLPR